jgi:hypothetical protein
MAAQEFEGQEFEFPDEREITPVGKATEAKEVSIDIDEDGDVEVDIIDDTPESDRGREPLPKELVDELEKDDLTDYSERVKERMSQLRKVYHDERREKESAAREREEAIKFAKALAEENKRLKSTLSSGEETYIQVARQAAENQLNLAKREYREAYDTGDTERIVEAQQRLNEAQLRHMQANNYQPQYQNALQEQENQVYIQEERFQPPPVDRKAQNWQAKNEWFGSDAEMTSLALGLHQKLVQSGIDPTSDDYYHRIDNTMRKRFPEYFGTDSLDEDKPAQRTKTTVVAPVTRSTAPKKVHLTRSASALAKKLGLTPEQYARELMKLETK